MELFFKKKLIMIDEPLNKSEADECISLIQVILNDYKRIKATIVRIQSSAEINPFPPHFQKHIYDSYILAATSNNKNPSKT